MNKYRAGKIKREHSIIEGLWPLLERMAECELITSIIPGPISRLKSRTNALTFQRFTDTGLRLLAKNGSAVQEVYAVAPDKEAVLAWLGEKGLIASVPPAEPVAPAPTRPVGRKAVTLPHDTACQQCGKLMMAGTRGYAVGRGNYSYVHIRCAP